MWFALACAPPPSGGGGVGQPARLAGAPAADVLEASDSPDGGVVRVPAGARHALVEGTGAGVLGGPYAGAASSSGFTVWARLAEGVCAAPVLSRSADLADRWTGEVRCADPEHDGATQWAIDGLDADSTWYWAVEQEGALVLRATHTTRTFPADDASGVLRFVVFADVNAEYEAPAYRMAAGSDAAFALQIGDFDHRDPGLRNDDIEAWWAMHRDNLYAAPAGHDLDEGLLHEVPLFHMWDDHDYGRNNADRTAHFGDVARRAFRDYFPTPALPDPDRGLWYSFRAGPAEIFVLDLRSQRDPDDDPDAGEKSMLDGGVLDEAPQRTWLQEGLLDSTAQWKFIVSSSVWNPTSKPNDSWAEFAGEQAAITTFIHANGIEGVLFLSGDIHSGGAIDDGSHAGFPEISVPTTNLDPLDCTGGQCGDWSVGVVEADRPGFALVEVSVDEASGKQHVLMQALDADGEVRLEWGRGR
jgi:alkaline phosphatase D